MKIDPAVADILEGALEGQAAGRDACVQLLGVAPGSLDAGALRSVAQQIAWGRSGRAGMVFGQIGVETRPCAGHCSFCAFAAQQTGFSPWDMPIDEILSRSEAFTESRELCALFLMTMHGTDIDRLLESVSAVRRRIPADVDIVLNTGDFDVATARQLKAAGANGAYHILRLREGMDTALDPSTRLDTIRAIREAELDWYYCCEPIGPEHTDAELADQIMVGVEYGCRQHAAMRRVYLPDSPLAAHGQISELRLAQVVAVITVATVATESLQSVAVHEANLLGLTSGANVIWAETGANPRDTEAETSGHRGLDIADCKRLLFESGYTSILTPEGGNVSLC